jgi:hypothetical protein
MTQQTLALVWCFGVLVAPTVGCKRSNVEFTARPITLSEFTNQFAGFNLPLTASNLYYARSSIGLGGRALLYRFDAPVEDCLSYASQFLRSTASNAPSGRSVTSDLAALTKTPSPVPSEKLRAYKLGGVAWFDIENVTAGFSGVAGQGSGASFWIDSGRGRFYYLWTD